MTKRQLFTAFSVVSAVLSFQFPARADAASEEVFSPPAAIPRHHRMMSASSSLGRGQGPARDFYQTYGTSRKRVRMQYSE